MPTASVGLGDPGSPAPPAAAPRTATAADAVRLIDALVALPAWSDRSIAEALHAELAPSEQSTPMLTIHAARPAQGPFDTISVRVPTGAATTRDTRVVMEVADGVLLNRADVAASYGPSTPYQISSPASAARFVTHAHELQGGRLFLRCDPDGDQRVSSVVLCRGSCQ